MGQDLTPRVVVILINYNYEKYIGDAIDSVLRQTYPNLGLCVVDDHSSDSSWKVIHNRIFDGIEYETRTANEDECKFGKRENVHVAAIRLHENRGPSYARNVAIDNTINSADVYVVIDSDDIMYPFKVQRMVDIMNKSPKIGVVYGDYDILNEETGNVIREHKQPFSKAKLLEECIVHSGALITKEALLASKDEYGYYDINMRTCEDYDLWIRISEQYVIFHIAESLTLVRNQPNNSTLTVDKSIWEKNWARIGNKARVRQNANQQ